MESNLLRKVKFAVGGVDIIIKRKTAVNNLTEEIILISTSRNQTGDVEEQATESSPQQPVREQPN